MVKIIKTCVFLLIKYWLKMVEKRSNFKVTLLFLSFLQSFFLQNVEYYKKIIHFFDERNCVNTEIFTGI